MFMPRDVVWVKLHGKPWWPAEVISHEEYLDKATSKKETKSGVEPIFVRLFKLQKFYAISNKRWILPFNSIHKEANLINRQAIIKNPNNEAVTVRLLFDAALCEAQTAHKIRKSNDSPNGISFPHIYPTNGKLKITVMENENRIRRSSVDNVDFSSDSDNDELPLVNISQETKDAFPYAIDDVVWAKYRSYTHWPALVTKVYTKERKLSIIFIVPDLMKTRLKIGAKNIESFHLDRNQDFYRQGLACEIAKYFKESYQRAEDYLRKRGLGSVKNGLEFFHSVEAIENVKEVLTTKLSEDSLEYNDLFSIKTCSENTPKFKLEEEIPVEEKKISDQEKEVILTRQKENKKLLGLITRKSIKRHLMKIYQGKWSCERHNKFRSPRATVRRQLKEEYCFGPIVDEDQQEQLIRHIDDVLKDCGFLPKTFDRASYIFEVLIPEAIIKAISILQRCSQKDAENIFHSNSSKTTMINK